MSQRKQGEKGGWKGWTGVEAVRKTHVYNVEISSRTIMMYLVMELDFSFGCIFFPS